MVFSSPRQKQTTIPCPECTTHLVAKRSCHEANVYCEKCKKEFPIQCVIHQMDAALEEFMESLYCNRI